MLWEKAHPTAEAVTLNDFTIADWCNDRKQKKAAAHHHADAPGKGKKKEQAGADGKEAGQEASTLSHDIRPAQFQHS